MKGTTLVGAAVFLTLCHLALAWSLRGGQATSGDDLDRYWEIASLTGSRSGAVEHAPLAPAFFRLVAQTTGNRNDFRRSMIVAMVAADIAIAAALAWGFGWPAAIIYLVLAGPLLRLYYMRFDLLPTAAVAIGVALYRRGYPLMTGAALAIGAAFKLWPVVLWAWFARRWREPRALKAAASWLMTAGGVAVAWLASDGVAGVEEVVTFRGATGWQVESVGGAAVAASEGLGSLRLESDAWRVGTISPIVSIALLAAGTTAALCLAWLAAAPSSIGLAWLSGVLALLVFAPILSPQYIVWITPAAAIAFTEGHRVPASLAASAIPLTVVMMGGYGALLAREDWAVWLIVLRNGMLVAAFVACAVAIWRMREPRQDIAPAPTSALE